jgi:hypothetical protein
MSTGVYPIRAPEMTSHLALVTKITVRLSWQAVTNTLAYSTAAGTTTVESFVEFAPVETKIQRVSSQRLKTFVFRHQN